MKYTNQQLKEKAEDFLAYYHEGDMRCQFLLMVLCNSCGMSESQVIAKINKLADWEES